MIFEINNITDFSNNIRREWVLTNGLGGYAGSSITGAHNRTHQGYLIASLKAPVNRYVCFSKTNEKVNAMNNEYDLTTSMYKGGKIKDGNKFLSKFTYDGTICYTYNLNNITVKKHISLVQGKNISAIGYEIINKSSSDITLTVTPLMNFREHSENVTREDLKFDITTNNNGFMLIPERNSDVKIFLSFSDGELIPRTDLYEEDMMLQTEVDNEVDGLDSHFTPFDIDFCVAANSTKHVSIVCSVNENVYNEISDETAFEIKNKQLEFTQMLIKKSKMPDDFSQTLAVAANQFICYRKSTGYSTVLAGLPWFTDWGRDTMIAYTGLTLCTKRFDEAHDILLTFAKYFKDGLIPNMFPDDGQEPLYNTVDASLWYFYAVYKYLEYVNTDEAFSFIREEIYPVLVQIIEAYKKGTDFSIYMDSDYLIHAGSGLDQVTWMDVRVGDWVATPRHGKPVEINALWYNALRTMEFLAQKFDNDSSYYSKLAEKVSNSFVREFWNEDSKCLYDVVDDEKDPTIRPNQIYAVSLPFTMLDPEKEKSIVDVVKEKLYVGCGLRSLDPDHKDYHPIYIGSLDKRDHAYHQGTAWGFLLGGFISAYVKVNGNTKSAKQEAKELLSPIEEHFYQNCIGSICEIFDGDAPHNGRGCYAQAWSVGEVLRCYCEDILTP